MNTEVEAIAASETSDGKARMMLWGASVGAACYVCLLLAYVAHEWGHFLAMKPVDFGEFLAGSLAPLGVLGLLLTIVQGHAALARARDANAIARTIGQAQVRCYLSPRDVKLKMEGTGSPTLQMAVWNSGQSPANEFGFTFHVCLKNVTDEWTWESGAAQVPEEDGRIVAASEDADCSLTIIDGRQMPQGQLSDFLLDPRTIIKVQVAAGWRDVFGTRFRETWRFQADLKVNLLDEAAPLWPDSPSVVGLNT